MAAAEEWVREPSREQAKDALRDKALPVTSVIFDAATGRSYLRGSGAVGASGDQSETPLLLQESARESATDNRSS